jgi:2-dehydro-3-deoxyphosphogluconate aldolase/(4S)-4-hydroxy-2-oxoglutarate aldolase
VEVTLDTPDALQSIHKLSRAFSGEIIIGAGTVLDRETARQAISAGARFILSPTLDTSVIDYCGQNAVLSIPGVFSPSEIASAKKAGAVVVKVFPASLLGVGYIERMLRLFENLEILAVGGIDLGNVGDFIQSGAIGTGVGSQLVGKKIVDTQDYGLLERRTAQFLQKIQSARPIT